MKKYSTEIERRDLVRKHDVGGDEHSVSGPSMETRSLNKAKLIRWKNSLARKDRNDRLVPPVTERGTKSQISISHCIH